MSAKQGTRKLSRTKYIVERFTVSVLSGADTPMSARSDDIEFTIGTAQGNHLQLTDPAVSAHHCVLSATPSGVELRDPGSTNGISLGGYRITSGYLIPGATFAIGETVLRFESDGEQLTGPLSGEDRFGPVLGRSVQMRRLFALVERIAPSDATVLVEGETGTGKGLLAEAIHQASPRADQPFVVIDCATIPSNLIESELFGHERGAFTGAQTARTGLFETAQGGTVFLDEIGELPPELQPKLLRVLENRVVRRVGSQRPIPVDVRIIAATNRDLRQEVNRGTFRHDLWYRLNTIRLLIPPLRERREDIALLVAHFYSQMSRDSGAYPPSQLVTAMQRNPWKGNVRELASAVERAMIFDNPEAWDDIVNPRGEVSTAFDPSLTFRAAKMRATAAWERDYFRELLAHHDGNLSRAARAARMDRSHLRTLARRHGLLPPGRTSGK